MARYRKLRKLGTEALFEASVDEETTLKVMSFMKGILNGAASCISEKEATTCGSAIPQNTQADQSSEQILDPEKIASRGAPRQRIKDFLEKPRKRVIHCGFCHKAGHTIRTCETYKRQAVHCKIKRVTIHLGLCSEL
jgi:hypothetical protein